MSLPPLTPNAWLRWDVVERLLPADARSVLEVGCGQGGVGARLALRYDYVGVEPDARSCAVARDRLTAVGRGEVLQGTVPEAVDRHEPFDLLCSFEVIEHLSDDLGALRSWLSLVRPGGHVVLSTPAFADRYGPSDAMVGHYRRYDPDAFTELLKRAGLVDVRVVVYGAGLGVALERVRNAIGARRLRRAGLPVPRSAPADLDSAVMSELSAGSGRLFQPPAGAAKAVELATGPFRWYQRRAGTRGTGLVAIGRKP